MKKNKINSNDIYLGNLFVVENGIGKVSDKKYAVVKTKKHPFSRPKYLAMPDKTEVYVGSYIITIHNEGLPFLINATKLSNTIGYKKVTLAEVNDLIQNNNTGYAKRINI